MRHALPHVMRGLPPFVHAQINFGKIGQKVNILGNKLIGTTSITLNGTPAEFKVISDIYLRAQVPTGATTGHARSHGAGRTAQQQRAVLCPAL